jgi:hypothetical protein
MYVPRARLRKLREQAPYRISRFTLVGWSACNPTGWNSPVPGPDHSHADDAGDYAERQHDTACERLLRRLVASYP